MNGHRAEGSVEVLNFVSVPMGNTGVDITPFSEASSHTLLLPVIGVASCRKCISLHLCAFQH